MTFLPVSQEWESIWHWQTPTDASPGDRFSIQGRVHDRHGHESPVELGSGVDSLVIEVGDPGLRAVFQTPRDGNSEVYRINTDGTDLVNLTQALSGESYPLWSPDGQSVLFLSTRDGNEEIYIMNADGTGQTNLTNHPAADGIPGDYACASWSPTGGQIAFLSNRTGNQQIFVMNADGTGQTQVTNNPSLKHLSVAWSPKGDRLAYATIPQVGSTWMDYRLSCMKTDGTDNLILVPNGSWGLMNATWSPGGSQIAYSTGSPAFSLYVINSDGTGQIQLTSPTNSDFVPRWSPDGKQIAFTRGYNQLGRVNADATGLNLTTFPLKMPFYSSPHVMVYDRSATKVAFVSDERVYVMDPDGSNQVNLSQSNFSEGWPDLR
jgi:TolB protein